MNREQYREFIKQHRDMKRKYINSDIQIILASLAELLNTPLIYVENKYLQSDDKGKFIEDAKYVIQKMQSGELEFDTGMLTLRKPN